MRKASLLCAICVLTPAAAFALPSDNFDDNVQGSQWQLVEDDGSKVSLTETSQHLVGVSDGSTNYFGDALYYSSGPAGFALSTAANFSFRIDYHLGEVGTGSLSTGSFQPSIGLDLGLGTNVSGDNSMAFGYAASPLGPVTLTGYAGEYRTGGVSGGLIGPTSAVAPAGTLYISYDAGTDTVYLSQTGYFTGNSFVGVLQGEWAASQVFVAFGIRAQNAATLDNQTYLDNFVVESGSIVPEPASLALLAIGGLSLIRRPRNPRKFGAA